jgi:hypothetical protein
MLAQALARLGLVAPEEQEARILSPGHLFQQRRDGKRRLIRNITGGHDDPLGGPFRHGEKAVDNNTGRPLRAAKLTIS